MNCTIKKVDTYKGYDIYIDPKLNKESVATMIPDSNNIARVIVIRKEAYEILISRPDFLERIYEHEIKENVNNEEVKHGEDNDILEFLKKNGYDFGTFKF